MSLSWNDAVLCLSGLLGTVGFALLFRIHYRRLPFAAAGGLLATVALVLATCLTDSDLFVSNLIAAAVATAYCETMARVIRTPVTVLLLPSVVPLVPGGSLYYTMRYLVSGDREQFASYGLVTVKVCLGIAVGIMAVSVALQLWMSHFRKSPKASAQ